MVLCGAQGADEAISEAEPMARYVLRNGLTEDDIVQEDCSTTTEENIRCTQQRLNERDLADSRIVFVTNDYHVLRTASLAQRIGTNSTVIGAQTALYYVPAGFLREFVATVRHFWRQNVIAWGIMPLIVALTFGSWYLESRQEFPVDEQGRYITTTPTPK